VKESAEYDPQQSLEQLTVGRGIMLAAPNAETCSPQGHGDSSHSGGFVPRLGRTSCARVPGQSVAPCAFGAGRYEFGAKLLGAGQVVRGRMPVKDGFLRQVRQASSTRFLPNDFARYRALSAARMIEFQPSSRRQSKLATPQLMVAWPGMVFVFCASISRQLGEMIRAHPCWWFFEQSCLTVCFRGIMVPQFLGVFCL
jgi:hypothetical protein